MIFSRVVRYPVIQPRWEKNECHFWGSPGVASPPNKHPFGVGTKSLTKSGLPERKTFQNLKQHLTNYCLFKNNHPNCCGGDSWELLFVGSPRVSRNFEKFHHHQKVPQPIQQPPAEVGWAPLTTFSQSHVQATSCSELQSLGTFKSENSFLEDLEFWEECWSWLITWSCWCFQVLFHLDLLRLGFTCRHRMSLLLPNNHKFIRIWATPLSMLACHYQDSRKFPTKTNVSKLCGDFFASSGGRSNPYIFLDKKGVPTNLIESAEASRETLGQCP